MQNTQYLTTDLTKLVEFATFEKQKHMDETIYEYIRQLRQDEAPESTIEVLRFFGKSSLRVLGVSFAKIDTIAKQSNVSRSTVKRAVKRLVDYGMIERLPTLKKWKGSSRRKSVNIVRILAGVNQQDEPSAVSEEHNEGKTFADENNFEPSKYKQNTSYILDTAQAVKNAIPTPIYDVLGPFYNARELRNLTGIIFRAKASIDHSLRIERHAEDFKAVVLDVVRRVKQGEVKRIDGYLYAAIRRLFKRLQYVEFADDVYY